MRAMRRSTVLRRGVLVFTTQRKAVMNGNRSEQQAQDAKVILGIQKDLLSVPTLSLAGQAITPADLEKLVQSRIDSANAIAPAKVKWTAAVQAYRMLNKQVTPVSGPCVLT